MATLVLTFSDEEMAAVREASQRANMSPEDWAVDVIKKFANAPDQRHWVDRFLEIADRAGGDSTGRVWTREELYERPSQSGN